MPPLGALLEMLINAWGPKLSKPHTDLHPYCSAGVGQLTLPLRYGGMGIGATSMMEATAAFLRAAAVTEKALNARLLTFRPFSGPAGPRRIHDWYALHSATGELWPVATPEVDHRCIGKVLPRVQQIVSKFQAQSKSEQLLS